ncbi:carbohydrate ABC transporter permease [Rhodobium gokarnense]|uniref:Multiple sugar transport system permease protein n=1 Tax=Rhodobium gokarnense TaxID=364296 RepID=A0ABT3HF09_9HYPH|nr:sugar ABC transporter permease [Rhodobium gokarnense]MCW2308924.1 multiple sugar transport system permease protein [Rhodobium gokarnense]
MTAGAHARTVPYLFVAPAVALMVVILLVPVAIAVLLSFTDYSLGNADFSFVGIDNYEDIFSRRTYGKMIASSLLYAGVVVPASIGLGAALLISSLRFAQDFYKAVFFLPTMAALLAMAIVWEFMLNPTIGSINALLSAGCGSPFWHGLLTGAFLGIDPATTWYGNACATGFPLWLGDRAYALWTLCFIGVWQAFGFNMVLYLAGLTAIPRELYHAAEMDGASSAWDRFRLVTWPLLGPTTVFVVTITTIRSFQVFDSVEALTAGGPSKSTYVMMYAIYEKAIRQNLIGIGAAITVVFLIFVMVVTLIQRHYVEKRVHYS